MMDLWQNLKYAIHMMHKRPTLTFIFILVIGLTVGANTSIFSIVNAVILTPLPYREADRLVMLWETNPKLQQGMENFPVADGNFVAWRDQSKLFEAMSA